MGLPHCNDLRRGSYLVAGHVHKFLRSCEDRQDVPCDWTSIPYQKPFTLLYPEQSAALVMLLPLDDFGLERLCVACHILSHLVFVCKVVGHVCHSVRRQRINETVSVIGAHIFEPEAVGLLKVGAE